MTREIPGWDLGLVDVVGRIQASDGWLFLSRREPLSAVSRALAEELNFGSPEMFWFIWFKAEPERLRV